MCDCQANSIIASLTTGHSRFNLSTDIRTTYRLGQAGSNPTSFAYFSCCSRHPTNLRVANHSPPASVPCIISGERYVLTSSHPRLYSIAVHHVISTTSRLEATTILFFFRYISSSRLAASAATALSWSTPILQTYYLLHPDILFRPRHPRLQRHFE